MPNELSDLELDEVSLVGKAANGKRFLIYKNSKGVPMTKTKPAGATKAGASEAQVTKADIISIVEKAVAPLQEENAKLRKSLAKQNEILRKKDYEQIAKSEFSELGSTEEVTTILKSLEGLPSEARKPIIKTLKAANAMRKEAGAMLFKSVGHSRPAPGSHRAEFYSLVEKKQGEIRKSDSGKAIKDAMVLKSIAMDEVSKEYPELAQQVLREEREAQIQSQMGVA
jgi:hypothetical protein